MMGRAAVVALVGALPFQAAAYDIACPVQTICEGHACHKAEAGMRLTVLVEQAGSATPVLMSDAGPVPAHRSRTRSGVRFDGRNDFGMQEVLSADLTAGTFIYLRRGTGAGSDITYQGTCAVVR